MAGHVDQVHSMAVRLRAYATHFEMSDWDYTRDLGDLREIRYDDPTDRLPWRLKNAAKALFRVKKDALDDVIKVSRLAMAVTYLRREQYRPNGVLDGGSIITYWEETGQYLQFVQPSVGALLANLMDAHPNLPEVRAIATEMKRINDRYHARLADAE